MAYIVTEPCINCKYTDCAAVCPVDAFREGPNFLTIDPDDCIDCDACVSECPVEAIYADDEVPEKWDDRIINETKDPLPEADKWAEVEDKEKELKEDWD